ncbi:unnamed protein product [Nezara viridula]|uniref:Uncharacterized protein n=1 Tax=Nezara viridula TaxID=85310 RepID=A0A9P0HAZ4_NEZVI|nr:unnamed protein product [Nezara viridula]
MRASNINNNNNNKGVMVEGGTPGQWTMRLALAGFKHSPVSKGERSVEQRPSDSLRTLIMMNAYKTLSKANLLKDLNILLILNWITRRDALDRKSVSTANPSPHAYHPKQVYQSAGRQLRIRDDTKTKSPANPRHLSSLHQSDCPIAIICNSLHYRSSSVVIASSPPFWRNGSQFASSLLVEDSGA